MLDSASSQDAYQRNKAIFQVLVVVLTIVLVVVLVGVLAGVPLAALALVLPPPDDWPGI
jgi:hypothetical protein